ncbi:MAG TPA: hypothetical protein VKB51_08930 [bacterium]|nr:hypothetical protein [bacterium]
MAQRSRDDYRPGWYVLLERAFDVMLRGAVVLVWVWGLAVFLFVAWGIWVTFFQPHH